MPWRCRCVVALPGIIGGHWNQMWCVPDLRMKENETAKHRYKEPQARIDTHSALCKVGHTINGRPDLLYAAASLVSCAKKININCVLRLAC